MDYTQLIERLRLAARNDSVFGDDVREHASEQAANKIEALQERVTELEDDAFVLRGMLRLAHGERDAALAKLRELEAQPSPTALELMTEYSNGKQWALEEAAKVCERLWPDKDCSGHEWSDGWADGTCASADAIRKLKEGL